jgi:hypothetical protein
MCACAPRVRAQKVQEELRQLRVLRDEYDDRIQRLRWTVQGQGGAVTADEEVSGASRAAGLRLVPHAKHFVARRLRTASQHASCSKAART